MNAADLHIGRVVLRGTAPAVEHARRQLPTALARAPWPTDDTIVVVRRVAVGGTATELPGRAAAAAEHLARRAVDPWSPAADAAEAVRFRDALDYRACLVRDLLTGTAAHRWLWRHRAALLARPTAEALAELLAEDALALPTLLDRPALRDSLPALWRTLDAPAAREILAAIGSASGWQAAITAALDPTTHERRAEKRSAFRRMSNGETGETAVPAAPVHTAAQWPNAALGSSALRFSLSDDLPPSDTRIVLQTVLALWSHSPATLAGPDADEALRATAESFVRAAPSAATSTTASRKPHTITANATAKTGAHTSDRTDAGAPGTSQPPNDTAQGAAPPRPTANAALPDTATAHPAGKAPPPSAAHRVSSTAASPAVFPPAADVDFHTRGGGFFFLLNVLNLPALRDWRAALSGPQPRTVRAEPVDAPALRQALKKQLPYVIADRPIPFGLSPSTLLRTGLSKPCRDPALRQACPEQGRRAQGERRLFLRLALPRRGGAYFAQDERTGKTTGAVAEPHAGWRELVRLACRLHFTPDAPLAAFLADACALDADDDPIAALATLPAGADPAPVRHAAQRHYGEAALAAALAERPARVRATRSHLDVHLRLADVNLDIRRTGLDLDPGWLPWLGRVVHFHYD